MKMCQSQEGTLVKILPSNSSNTNSFDGNVLCISGISSSKEMDEYVVLESHMYQKIFKSKKIHADDAHKRLSIVKISCNGKSIHRAFYSVPAKDLTQDYVALSTKSIYLLSKEKSLSLGSKVYLSRGSIWKFYWNHPIAAVWMSFRMGIFGILFTLIGVNLTNICRYITSFVTWLTNCL